MPSATAAASIIVPTFREAANLRPLIERAFAALASKSIEAELIVVDDDSQDGTAEIIDNLRSRYPVRLVVRQDQRGLSSAVLRGFAEARFDRFVVMDADLQHPPERIPDLIHTLAQDGCEFVVGSRYVPGAEIGEHWPLLRRLASRLATALARPLVAVRDPMSGFFALRREVWQRATKLNPIGYKIALELMVKGRCPRPKEVPIDFAKRAAGESKLGLGVSTQYLRHLMHLYAYRFRRHVLIALFLIAGAIALSASILH